MDLQAFQGNYKPKSNLIDIELLKKEGNHIQYKLGDYFGQLKGTKKQGIGVILFNDGRIFEGNFKNDKKHGVGFMLYPSGAKYEGNYYEGKRQGKGRFQSANGEIYDGEWVQGLRHGSGIWQGSKGDQYVGEWKKDQVDGFGIHIWINGDRYEGQFKNFLKHGQGTEKFINGDSYEGEYKGGKPDGNGIYKWKNGNEYKGNFKEGYRHGYGQWKNNQKNEEYEGEYKWDKKNGVGIFKWSNGNYYEGQFKNDLRHGEGKLVFKEGKEYKGVWENGKFNQNSDIEQERGNFRISRNNSQQNYSSEIIQGKPTKINQSYDMVPSSSNQSSSQSLKRITLQKQKEQHQSFDSLLTRPQSRNMIKINNRNRDPKKKFQIKKNVWKPVVSNQYLAKLKF